MGRRNRKQKTEQTPQTPDVKIGTIIGENQIMDILPHGVSIKNRNGGIDGAMPRELVEILHKVIDLPNAKELVIADGWGDALVDRYVK